MRFLAVLLLTLLVAIAFAGEPWQEYGAFAKGYDALAPTPEGEGHLGLVESGKFVQLRFSLPAELPAAAWLTLDNVVAYTGKGQSYQLVLRRDKADGAVVFEGPVLTNGDVWNERNREPADLTPALTAEDCRRGYVDIYVTGIVTGDGWTVYRQRPGRPMALHAAVLTPEMKQQMANTKTLRERGINLLPVPREVTAGAGSVALEQMQTVGLDAATAELFLAELNDRAQELGVTKPLPRPDMIPRAPAGARPFVMLGPAGRLPLPKLPPRTGHLEGYLLQAGAGAVSVWGDNPAGLFYGLQTLRQLLRVEGGKLVVPEITIRDWPSYPLRGYQYDIARGQTVDIEFCKRVIRQSARYKLNAIMFYMEDDYKFEKYPFLGRPGTFDKAKALELSKYADQYHVMLIPQYESLGHAGAQLGHPEMQDLRENGNPWVYCTNEPKVWEFLDAAFAELAEAFPNSKYIHVGGDEFEMSFGLCPKCKAIVAEKGYEGLYALHMNKLYDLCRKYKREMLFWPSHAGPSPELSYLTLKAKDMTRDCIPTEWIYHGPASYPEIEEYQKAGFKDVWVSPAVVDYSVIWPDYTMTFRGIRGFYQAGADRQVKGAMCTSWELMYGALFENSWYGFIYAAECGWSLGQLPRADYDRSFAANWFGLTQPEAADWIATTLNRPFPVGGKLGIWGNPNLIQKASWTPPAEFRRKWMQRYPQMGEGAAEWAQALDASLSRVAQMRKLANANRETLDAAEAGLRLMRQLASKCQAFDKAANAYAAARDKAAAGAVKDAPEQLAVAATALRGLLPEYAWLTEKYQYAVDHWGHWSGDVKALQQQAAGLEAMAAKLDDLSRQVTAGQLTKLPVGEAVGLGQKPVVLVGNWTPDQMSEEFNEIRLDVTPFIKAPGTYRFEWQYTHGAHALALQRVALVGDGQVVAEDVHDGGTGASTFGNVYVLTLEQFTAGKKYELAATVASRGGPDSNGEVSLVVD